MDGMTEASTRKLSRQQRRILADFGSQLATGVGTNRDGETVVRWHPWPRGYHPTQSERACMSRSLARLVDRGLIARCHWLRRLIVTPAGLAAIEQVRAGVAETANKESGDGLLAV
jgi:hypothetical protein